MDKDIMILEKYIKRYRELKEENRRMIKNRFSADDIENLQEEAYYKGRNDENIYYKNIVKNHYLLKSKIKEMIEKEIQELNNKILNAEKFDEHIEEYRYKKQALQDISEKLLENKGE